jgi:hypothetical protein
MLLGKLSLPTLESLHITKPLIQSLHEVVPLWTIYFPRNAEWRFQPYHVDFFDGIVGANSLGLISIPLIPSFGDLSLERVFAMLFVDIVHSCSSY